MKTRTRTGLLAAVAGLLLGLCGCGEAERVAPPATAAPTPGPLPAPASEAARPREADPTTSAETAALATADAAATELAQTLRARLMSAMAEGGPTRAAEVCATEAPALTAAIASRTGARVGRASLRMRATSAPPEWVSAWLLAQGERPSEGVTGFARIEEGHARVLRPIAVEAPCLTCHGDAITPEIAAILEARYPADRARGYAQGDLRGALWAEADIATR